MSQKLSKKQKGPAPAIVLRLKPETRATLEKLAEADRRKLSEYTRMVLEDHVACAGKQRGK